MKHSDSPGGTESRQFQEKTILVERDFDGAVELLTEAFLDNPAQIYMFPNKQQRHTTLRWLFRRNLAALSQLRHSFCVVQQPVNSSGRKIIAMGFWYPPGANSICLRGILNLRSLDIPLHCGVRSYWRIVRTTQFLEKERYAAIGHVPHWYLNYVAVAKDFRGTGLGSEIIKQELRDTVGRTGHIAVLATQRHDAVRFYQRLGFEIVSDRPVNFGPSSYPNWLMAYDPTGRSGDIFRGRS